MNYSHEDFWNALDELVNTSEIVIDRPKGSAHPRFPDFIYQVDYGYLKNTSSMDGAGIDVEIGHGSVVCWTQIYRVSDNSYPDSGQEAYQ